MAEAREGADVGGHRQVDFLDDEERVFRGVAHVGAGARDRPRRRCSRLGPPAAPACAPRRGRRTSSAGAALRRAGSSRARPVSARAAPSPPTPCPSVNTDKSMPAEKCLPVEEMTIARAEASSLISFTIAGSSFQNARVMVLNASGRFSWMCATLSLVSTLKQVCGHGLRPCMRCEWRWAVHSMRVAPRQIALRLSALLDRLRAIPYNPGPSKASPRLGLGSSVGRAAD